MPSTFTPARSLALVVAAAVATSACASKGYVNRKIDQFVGVERTAREAGDSANSRDIAAVRTDLNAFDVGERSILENHGYWLADAALRRHMPALVANPNIPFAWPHAEWSDETKACRALADSGSRHLLRDLWRFVLAPGS